MVQYGPIVDTNVAPVSPATRGLRDYFYFLLYLEQEFEPHRCPRLLGD